MLQAQHESDNSQVFLATDRWKIDVCLCLAGLWLDSSKFWFSKDYHVNDCLASYVRQELHTRDIGVRSTWQRAFEHSAVKVCRNMQCLLVFLHTFKPDCISMWSNLMHATLHSEGTKCRFNTSSFGSRTFFSSKKAVHSAGPQNKAAGSIDQSASIRNLQVAQDQDADEGSLWVAAEWWFLAGATEGFVLTRCVVHADSFGTDCCHACPQTLPLGRLLSTHCWTRTSTQTNVEQST